MKKTLIALAVLAFSASAFAHNTPIVTVITPATSVSGNTTTYTGTTTNTVSSTAEGLTSSYSVLNGLGTSTHASSAFATNTSTVGTNISATPSSVSPTTTANSTGYTVNAVSGNSSGGQVGAGGAYSVSNQIGSASINANVSASNTPFTTNTTAVIDTATPILGGLFGYSHSTSGGVSTTTNGATTALGNSTLESSAQTATSSSASLTGSSYGNVGQVISTGNASNTSTLNVGLVNGGVKATGITGGVDTSTASVSGYGGQNVSYGAQGLITVGTGNAAVTNVGSLQNGSFSANVTVTNVKPAAATPLSTN